MPAKRALAAPRDVVYLYDGSLAGFFNCVYESVYQHELPAAIMPEQEAQPSLMLEKWIDSDPDRAARVRASIPRKISPRALALVESVFLSCMEKKEIRTLRFLLLGYAHGGRVMQMLGHPDVAPLLAAARHLGGECHLLKGFIRFSDYGGMLAATITPKNFVLPRLAGHFIARYPHEDFTICDKTHGCALIYENRICRMVRIDELEFPPADETEERYRALWRQFYKTIAIEARHNPKCRMTHMPKRYWENMTEMREYL